MQQEGLASEKESHLRLSLGLDLALVPLFTLTRRLVRLFGLLDA